MIRSVHSTGRGKFREIVLQGAVVLWAAVVFFHYFHGPQGLDFSFVARFFSSPGPMDEKKLAANSLEFLKIVLGSIWIIFTLWRIGRKIFYWTGLTLENGFLRFSVEMALGILGMNGFWLGLGLNRLWFLSLEMGSIGVLGVWALWDLRKTAMAFQRLPRFRWPGWLYVSLVALGFLFLALAVIQGLLPEIYYDGLVYHLSTLSYWGFHHGIVDLRTNLYSNYPFGAELYFFNGFFLQGGETAKMLNVFTAFLCALAAAGWMMEEAGEVSGCLGWALVLFFPWVTSTVWTTQNDIFLAFLFILFYYSLFRWAREKEGSPWFLAVGIFGGAVLTVKYTGFIGVVAGFAAIGLTQWKAFSPKRWRRWGWVLALMGFSVAPWFLKNLIYTGNGFYPYFSHWLGGKSISPGKMMELMNDHQSVFFRGFSPAEWLGRVLGRDLDKTVAPILLSFLPFLFFPGRRRPAVRSLAVLGALLLLGGFLVSHILRLMIPAFLVCFMLFVLNLADLKNKNWTPVGAWIILLFGVLSFLSLGRLSVDYYHGDQMWLGKQTRQEYLAAALPSASYFDLTRVSGELPPSDGLLIAGDCRSLYYSRPFYANSVFDDQVLAVLARREKDGEGIWKGLRKMGVDDLVVAGSEGMRLARQYSYYDLNDLEWGKLDDLIQHHTELIYLKGLNGIYRVRQGPLERKSPIPNLLNFLKSPADNREKVL